MTNRHAALLPGAVTVLIVAGCASAPPSPPSKPVPPPAAARPADASNSSRGRFDCRTDRASALVDGVVRIRPGETLCLQLQSQDDSVTPIAMVASAGRGILVFTLLEEGGRTNLYVTNPLDVRLCYSAAMRLPGRSDTLPTSIWSVLSHRFGVEGWPQPIDELTLSNFKGVGKAEAGLVCK